MFNIYLKDYILKNIYASFSANFNFSMLIIFADLPHSNFNYKLPQELTDRRRDFFEKETEIKSFSNNRLA